MSSIEELKLDVAELQKLCSEASRSKVKDILTLEIRKLQTDIIKKAEQLKQAAEKLGNSDGSSSGNTPLVKSDEGRLYTKEITTYAWDQSEKFMKIYVTLNGVKNIAEGNVTSQFTDRSFKLYVKALDDKNHSCEVSHLFAEVDPSKSYHKIKTDMVLIMLKKVEEKNTWAYVTEKEQKTKDKKKPKMGDNSDPNDGMMTMLQQMYDDGDDEMKRTIGKAMYESRQKGGGEMGMPPMGMPPMDL